MDAIFVNGGSVRLYFENDKQRAISDVYDIKYNDDCAIINCNNGMLCIVNLDKVQAIEIMAVEIKKEAAAENKRR